MSKIKQAIYGMGIGFVGAIWLGVFLIGSQKPVSVNYSLHSAAVSQQTSRNFQTEHKIDMLNLYQSAMVFSTPSNNGKCSGTAVSHDVILTAKHCLPDGEAIIKNFETPDYYAIVDRVDVGDDISLIRVIGKTFENTSKISFDTHLVNDDVFYFGGIDQAPRLFRRGYIISINEKYTGLDSNGFFGDSGSAIFNEDGEIIGVMTMMFSGGRVDQQTIATYKFMAFESVVKIDSKTLARFDLLTDG